MQQKLVEKIEEIHNRQADWEFIFTLFDDLWVLNKMIPDNQSRTLLKMFLETLDEYIEYRLDELSQKCI